MEEKLRDDRGRELSLDRLGIGFRGIWRAFSLRELFIRLGLAVNEGSVSYSSSVTAWAEDIGETTGLYATGDMGCDAYIAITLACGRKFGTLVVKSEATA